ncbi:hypothetical protein [Flavobacterium sp. Root420]|uniref:hypothetical protein n=1 Tax=Flavobacterium sp. Root420 TaxID=1736533 RepID=UPI0006FC96CC|nr:hypothetical protein [Flavobacterium sp. Root420]KQX00760.1 hypothetical protein ASC72_07805 [Flavobacterium sp. Root420]
MQNLLLKNILPISFSILGILGAIATKNTQKVFEKIAVPRIGYVINAQGHCTDIPVNCGDLSPFICRLGITSGPIAYGKDNTGNCIEILYRP